MAGNPDATPPVLDVAATSRIGAKFQITISKLYVPVITLSMKNNFTFLENIKQGFNFLEQI